VTQVSVQGPGGYPKAIYGSFSGKSAAPVIKGIVSLLGAGGYSRAPYGSFTGKPAAPQVSGLPHNQPFHSSVGRMMGR
jgi:hypothetical protein